MDRATESVVECSYPAGDGFEAGKGELTVRADDTVATCSVLPFGAELTLKEVAPDSVAGGDWTDHELSVDTVTIGEYSTVEVTLTNLIDADRVSGCAGDPGKAWCPKHARWPRQAW